MVLGSMPGRASLIAGQYYAFPRNAFWPIMCEIFAMDQNLDYAQRVAVLEAQGMVLWDVLKTCTRSGSLDADIDQRSIVPNDLVGLLIRYPCIEAVYFNGATAEQVFRRHILPLLPAAGADLDLVRLPSTSPANASWSFERKLAAWRQIAERFPVRAHGGTNGTADHRG